MLRRLMFVAAAGLALTPPLRETTQPSLKGLVAPGKFAPDRSADPAKQHGPAMVVLYSRTQTRMLLSAR